MFPIDVDEGKQDDSGKRLRPELFTQADLEIKADTLKLKYSNDPEDILALHSANSFLKTDVIPNFV